MNEKEIPEEDWSHWVLEADIRVRKVARGADLKVTDNQRRANVTSELLDALRKNRRDA